VRPLHDAQSDYQNKWFLLNMLDQPGSMNGISCLDSLRLRKIITLPARTAICVWLGAGNLEMHLLGIPAAADFWLAPY
jgi:hypothetical protein